MWSVRRLDGMLADLRECAPKAREMPSGELAAAIRRAFGAEPLREKLLVEYPEQPYQHREDA